jgi:hypothetical protein
MRLLGNYLIEVGGTSPREFREIVKRQFLHHLSLRCTLIFSALQSYPGAPEYWRRDVEVAIEKLEASMATGDYLKLLDIEAVESEMDTLWVAQSLLKRCGELIQNWPDICAASRELRRGGEVFAITLS